MPALIISEKVSFRIYRLYGSYRLDKQVKRIIKILSESGVKNGDVAIPVQSTKEHSADIHGVKATTYNHGSDGSTVATAMSKEAFVKERADGQYLVGKFSLPAVRIGSVIEYEYTIEQDLVFNYGWDFQSDLPKLYSEVESISPTELNIHAVETSSSPFKDLGYTRASKIDSTLNAYVFSAPGMVNGTTMKTWVRKNVPAAIKEPFTYNISNYNDKLQFQITGMLWVDRNTWPEFNKFLLNNEEYFGTFYSKHSAIREKALYLTKNEPDTLKKARTIFRFVRDSFSVSTPIGKPAAQSPGKVFDRRTGTKDQVNYVLTLMLHQAGIRANPMLVSHRDKLKMLFMMPMWDRIDATVARMKIGDSTIFLDASGKYNPFGVLPSHYYNGLAWVVDKEGWFENLDPIGIHELNAYSVQTVNDSSERYTLAIENFYGLRTSSTLREKYAGDTVEIRKHLLSELKKISPSLSLVSYSITNLDNPDTSLYVNCRVRYTWERAQKVFFNPSFYNFFNENPFKSTHRYFPVEFPYPIKNRYSISIKFPSDYVAEFTPESLRIKLSDDDSYYYLSNYNAEDNSYVLRTNLTMKTVYYPQEDYADIRSFFDKVIELQRSKVILTHKN